MREEKFRTDSLPSCFSKYVFFRKEQISDIACAAFMDLD